MKRQHAKTVLVIAITILIMAISLFYVYAENDPHARNNIAYIEIQLGDDYSGRQFDVKTEGQQNTAVVTVQDDGVLMLEVSGDNKYFLTEKKETVRPETVALVSDESAASAEIASMEGTTQEGVILTTAPSGYEQTGTLLFGYIPVKNLVILVGGTVIIAAFLIFTSRDKFKKKQKNDDTD